MALPAFNSQIRGTKTGRAVLAEEAARVEASRLVAIYENHEFDLGTPTTNLSLDDAVNHATSCTCARASTGASTAAFFLIGRAQRVSIRNLGSNVVSVRMGDAAADKVSIDAGEYLDWNFMEITNLFLTNAGANACPVRIVLS